MKLYEFAWCLGEPFLPAIYGEVRRNIKELVKGKEQVQLIDIGARRSPYTIGLPVRVTLLDLPRSTEIQERLDLGYSEEVLVQVNRRRSNIERVVLEDMTKCTLPDKCYDGAICVEAIEHVEDDEHFVLHISRILKTDGWLFLTTPNGDYIRNEPPHYNPDHVRHYRKAALSDLLSKYFSDVRVSYGIRTGVYRRVGLRRLNIRHPFSSLMTMYCNVVNRRQSRNLGDESIRTAHLFALARGSKR